MGNGIIDTVLEDCAKRIYFSGEGLARLKDILKYIDYFLNIDMRVKYNASRI